METLSTEQTTNESELASKLKEAIALEKAKIEHKDDDVKFVRGETINLEKEQPESTTNNSDEEEDGDVSIEKVTKDQHGEVEMPTDHKEVGHDMGIEDCPYMRIQKK